MDNLIDKISGSSFDSNSGSGSSFDSGTGSGSSSISNKLQFTNDVCVKIDGTNIGKTTVKKKKKKNRCYNCNKKLGIMVFECKCSSVYKFCSNCICSVNHNCTYDYRNDKESLKQKLVKVDNEKIIKI